MPPWSQTQVLSRVGGHRGDRPGQAQSGTQRADGSGETSAGWGSVLSSSPPPTQRPIPSTSLSVKGEKIRSERAGVSLASPESQAKDGEYGLVPQAHLSP